MSRKAIRLIAMQLPHHQGNNPLDTFETVHGLEDMVRGWGQALAQVDFSVNPSMENSITGAQREELKGLLADLRANIISTIYCETAHTPEAFKILRSLNHG